MPNVFFSESEGGRPPPSDFDRRRTRGQHRKYKDMCRYYENFPLFPAQERGSWNCIQRPVSNHPLSRRRIPNVIRRRHLGFRHGRHQGLKAMCRHVRRTTPRHGGNGQGQDFNRAALQPAARSSRQLYQLAERHGPAARAARIERVKSRAGLNQTANGSATGFRTRNRNSAYSLQSWS